jgi:DNA helicase-2/ATP-dependent DNA helicase PcrA
MKENQIELTEEQKEIINLNEGQHLVLAPPGTGKTEILAQRVEKSIEKGTSQEKMICLTFTNRAAKVMKDRIEERHPDINVFIGNIHHYCSTFLFLNNLIPKYTSLIDEEDSYLLMIEAREFENIHRDIYIPDLLKLNTYLKQKRNGFPQDILLPPPANFLTDTQAQSICLKYEELKTESLLLDFDDLLTNTYLFLETNNHEYSMIDYSWIQVDEVQDINPIQWALIYKISNQVDSHKVFFGDYEQAIFSFIGARLENLHQIEHSCKIHNLQKNFRSPSYLLNIYIDFAKQYLSPKWKKDPIPNTTIQANKDDLLLVCISGTTLNEAEFIAKNILPLYQSKNELGQTAILVRTNNAADTFSKALTQYGIDHFKISGFDLFRRRVIKDLMSFCGCLTNKLDRVSWFRLFFLFSSFQSLKESRHFVNELFSKGLFPVDFLNISFNLHLQDFLNDYVTSRFLVFDTETTGLNVKEDDIIQIAATEVVNGVKMNSFNIYIKTEKSLHSSKNVHNITEEFLSCYGVSRKEAFESFISFLGNSTLVAHNLKFDFEILQNNLIRENIAIDLTKFKKYDTLQLSRRIYPKLNSYKLSTLLTYLNIGGKNTHNAVDDVDATVNLLSELVKSSLKLVPIQQEFISQNHKKLERFKEKLGGYWNEVQEKMNDDYSFDLLIEDYLKRLESLINYKLEEDEKIHLTKLTRHMVRCGKKNLKILLETHIPEYIRYKESDLLIGDELVVVSTVHKAKGLEFQNVIVPECVDAVYPSYYSKTQEQKNEDARTFYVAISRSKSRLTLTHHTLYISDRGNKFSRKRSPFVQCIEKHFLSYTK